MDADGDGFITKKEIMEQSIPSAHWGYMGMMMGNGMRGAPRLEVDEDSVYVHLGGNIYKLNPMDLTTKATFKMETRYMKPMMYGMNE